MTSPTTPFRAADHAASTKTHLLLACTGSVATIKLPQILSALSAHSATLSVRVILTASASRFLQAQSGEQPHFTSLLSLPVVEGIHTDADEWDPPWTRGGPVLHIELRRWADAMVIAPLSANSLAKVVGGLADNLVLSVVRAWDATGRIDGARRMDGSGKKELGVVKRIWVAPAMNTAMWMHPVTRKQLDVLEGEWTWFTVLTPAEKELACGDVGGGAMMEWSDIVSEIEAGLALGRSQVEAP